MSRRSPQHDLDTWLERNGYGQAHAAKRQTARPLETTARTEVPSLHHMFAYRTKHGTWANVWAVDADHAQQQIRKSCDTPGTFFSVSRVTNVPPRVIPSHHARKIHQEPTGREVFAAYERDHHITTAGRRALKASQFALPPGPDEKRRGIKGRLPIDTIARARNALSRASLMHQHSHLSSRQLVTVQRKVQRAWPSITVEISA